jgi:5,10-methylenetetrahydromethanopterin reductase
MLGVDRTAPARALREAVGVIRGLVAGSEQTLEGRVVRVRGARLDFEPPRAAVPILLGARGPRILEVAGEVADGVIVGNVATVEGWRLALRHVSAGARRAGRPREVPLVAWLYCSLAQDPRAALDAARPMAATSLVTSRPVLPELGVDLPPAFAEAMEAVGWSLRRDAVLRASGAVPDEAVRWFALAGRPEECGERLAALLREVPGISQVAVVPLPTPGQGVDQVVRQFAEEVAAGLAGPAGGGRAGDG